MHASCCERGEKVIKPKKRFDCIWRVCAGVRTRKGHLVIDLNDIALDLFGKQG